MDAANGVRLDLLIAGLTIESRWKKDAALRPYVDTRTVVGVPGGRLLRGDSESVGRSRGLGAGQSLQSREPRRHS